MAPAKQGRERKRIDSWLSKKRPQSNESGINEETTDFVVNARPNSNPLPRGEGETLSTRDQRNARGWFDDARQPTPYP